jgi:hypothetical protein
MNEGGASRCCNFFKRGDSANHSVSGATNSNKNSSINASNRSEGSLFDDDWIERLLDALRIDVDRRDTIVGDIFKKGLNAGEKRRLDLGLMVLGAPDTLFCDCPVLGLDSETSLHIMEFLKGYISKDVNRRVIVTLDRPSLFVWNLIDNVILLSKGRVVYEGPRFDMESFFAFHKKPTPARFSPLEHYIAVVNNFRADDNAVNWESAFKQWQEKADEDGGDDLADDIETCFPTAIPDVLLISSNNQTPISSFCGKRLPTFTFLELLHRSLLHTFKNPGMLGLRILMYTPFSLFLGLLFFHLHHDRSDQSVNSMAALLFYSSSFFIFMVVAILPFLATERLICRKEVLNGFYGPITHHLAVTVGSIPRVLILSFIITLILAGMVKLQNPVQFFLILLLALWNAESYALLMSICVGNYILGIIILAGIFGLAMPLEGFMLVPSAFPSWLRWLYLCPFHTYVFRSLMFNEFSGSSYGEMVLESYEIEDTNIRNDMLVLLGYSFIIHCVSVAVLRLCHHGISRKQKDL